jgi:hypothetical protein
MQLMQIEPDLLQGVADAADYAAEQTRIHIIAEIRGSIPELMETLSPDDPYPYAILPEVRADGSVHLPVLHSREEIRASPWIV